MAISYVVATMDPLAVVVRQWVRVISSFCGDWRREVDSRGVVTIRWDVPYSDSARPPTLSYRKGLFPTLVEDRWKRIEWFYYCDQEDGNTIRLYDGEFFTAHPHLYLERRNSGGDEGSYDDRVLLRGENLGLKQQELKVALLNCWCRPSWPAEAARLGDAEGERTYDLLRVTHCADWVAKRHAYFQHPFRNAMPEDDRSWRCASTVCGCRGVAEGFYTPDACPADRQQTDASPSERQQPLGPSILDKIRAAGSASGSPPAPPKTTPLPPTFPARLPNPDANRRRQELERRRLEFLPAIQFFFNWEPRELFALLAHEVNLMTDSEATVEDMEYFTKWLLWLWDNFGVPSSETSAGTTVSGNPGSGAE